jgi:hypothetical protein
MPYYSTDAQECKETMERAFRGLALLQTNPPRGPHDFRNIHLACAMEGWHLLSAVMGGIAGAGSPRGPGDAMEALTAKSRSRR